MFVLEVSFFQGLNSDICRGLVAFVSDHVHLKRRGLAYFGNIQIGAIFFLPESIPNLMNTKLFLVVNRAVQNKV